MTDVRADGVVPAVGEARTRPEPAAGGRARSAGRGGAWRSLPFVGPAWAIVIATGIIPLVNGVWLSVTNQSLSSPGDGFVGLQNYVRGVLTADFGAALLVTGVFVVVGIVIQFVAAYALASLLHQQMRGFQLFRTTLLIPMLLTPVVIGLIFRFMFQPSIGVMYYALHDIGISIPWFTDSFWAMVFVIMVDAWLNIPFLMLMILAGMAGMPEELLEAAKVDGANWLTRTRYVALPLLRPVITVALLIRVVDAARMFDQVYSTTHGGPGTSTTTATILAYEQTFSYFEFGQGAAMAIALTVLMFPVYFVYLRLTRV